METQKYRLMDVLYGHASMDTLIKSEAPQTKTSQNETPQSEIPSSEAESILQDLMGILPPETPSETPICYTCGSSEHSQKECPESWRVIEGISDVLEDQPEKGETGEEEEDVVRDSSDFLLNWTSSPSEDDMILHAIPMCAPYVTMTENRYRVKLTPGKMKKGAMAKSIVEMWLRTVTNEAEKKALKQMQMQDVVSVIINNSKAVLPSAKGKK